MDLKTLMVRKENGEQQPFSWDKFRNSLLKSKASPQRIEEVIREMEPHLYPEIQTREIYRRASALLKKQVPGQAARFGLKKAIMALGPSGFPFEKFVAELFTNKGFTTEVGLVLNGSCVSHEIDVLGRKGEELLLVECKFRNQAGMNVDVKVPLYIHSRFQDLLSNHLLSDGATRFTGWIATNTRFSDDAIAFARCKGIELLSWNYPEAHSLRDWIDASGLYPITCLTVLTSNEKRKLMDKGLVLVRDLARADTHLLELGLSGNRLSKAKAEVYELMK